MDSRTLAFAAEVLARTGGRGVDVVLNSLSGEAIAREPLGARGRRALRRDRQVATSSTPSSRGTPPSRRDLRRRRPGADAGGARRPASARCCLEIDGRGRDARALEPLPHRVFPLDEAAAAFRHMAQARHIGKIVITAPGATRAGCARRRRDRSSGRTAPTSITGGFGGLGLEVAGWLVGHGARHLVLMGRGGRRRATRAPRSRRCERRAPR